MEVVPNRLTNKSISTKRRKLCQELFSFKTLIFFSVYFHQFGTRLFEAKALLVMEGPEITGRRRKSIPSFY